MNARHYIHDVPLDPPEDEPAPQTERSFRDLKPSAERRRLSPQNRPEHDIHREHLPRRRSRWGIWVAATIACIVLTGVTTLFLFPQTTITLVPRSHVMPFDATNPLTAFPDSNAATGTIRYTVQSESIEDSAVVAASGVETAEEKATGSLTIYNETDQTMRLIKNTRFQTSDGLVFRIPASVDVPARAGSPGSIRVTVFADQTGPKYNVAPQDFTLPGLKSSPEMYAKIYAKSTEAFSGGFSGTRPAVLPAVLEAAKAEVRNRLTDKARESIRTREESLVFPGLMTISFESLPPTMETNGVRIHEEATVTIPIFPKDQFAHALAQAVSADAEGQSVAIHFSPDIVAAPVGELLAADLGSQPIVFTLSGKGQLVWNIDEKALTTALAGREESAFKPIVEGFLAIEAATARITPFWRNSFPAAAEDISITIEAPAEPI